MLITAPRQNLGAVYEAEIRPRLTLEAVYVGLTWSSNRGRFWRAPCPLHGGDNPEAFSVDTETLGWRCFTGEHRGDVLAYLNGGESPRGQAYVAAVTRAAELAGVALDQATLPANAGKGRGRRDVARVELHRAFALSPSESALSDTPPEPEPELPASALATELDQRRQALERAQAAFAGSPAAAYCESRGIPAELAARYGAGYVASWREFVAAAGDDASRLRSDGARVVFPLEVSDGSLYNIQKVNVSNVYGRSLDPAAAPGYARHAYLSGPKGIFNAGALAQAEEVFVAEATFDALALIAAGHANAVALGGLELPAAAFSHLRAINLCLDGDTAGSNGLHRLADAGRQMGLRVNCLPPAALAGHKDLSAAWQATGHLDLGAEPPARALPADLAQKRAPTMPQEARDSPPAIEGPRVSASVAQAPYRPHHVTAPAWDAGTLALIARFEQSAPPAEPFRLGPGVTVAGPEKAWQAWRGDIATGPTGPRSRGALRADLARLAELQLI